MDDLLCKATQKSYRDKNLKYCDHIYFEQCILVENDIFIFVHHKIKIHMRVEIEYTSFQHVNVINISF